MSFALKIIFVGKDLHKLMRVSTHSIVYELLNDIKVKFDVEGNDYRLYLPSNGGKEASKLLDLNKKLFDYDLQANVIFSKKKKYINFFIS